MTDTVEGALALLFVIIQREKKISTIPKRLHEEAHLTIAATPVDIPTLKDL
jgi:hypothetical protein